MQRTTLSLRNVVDSVPAEYTMENSFRGICLYWEAHRGQGKICYNDPKTGEQQHPIHVHFKGLCQPLHYLEPTQEYGVLACAWAQQQLVAAGLECETLRKACA